MSAWSSDFEAAPKDGTQILVRHANWSCPAVMHWVKEDEDGNDPFWCFSEETLADIAEGLTDTSGCTWALIPA